MNTQTTMRPIPENETGDDEILSLIPYTGPWTKEEAAHLLRRTLFGPTRQQILDAVANGMNNTVDTLLAPVTDTLPLTFSTDDAISNVGESWVNEYMPAGDQQPTIVARFASLFGWISQNLFEPNLSIREKMTLFWQNHFAVTY